jgi:protein kinase-like protein/nuclease-like protein
MARLLRNPFEKQTANDSKGLLFERYVMLYLSEHLSNQYIVIPNVILDNSSDTLDSQGAVTRREVDHLVVGPNGFFLLEAKYYPGVVEGLLWGLWDVTVLDQQGLPTPYRRKSERKEAVALETRMYRVTSIIEKYINTTKQASLRPYKKVRGIFVFPEGTTLEFRAKDGTPVHPQADVRAVTLDKLVASIDGDPPPRSAPPIPKNEVLKLSKVLDGGLVPSTTRNPTAGKIIGHYWLKEEMYKDQAPNGLNFTVYRVEDLNTGINHRGKYYDWSPMDKNTQATWTEQIRRHKNALSALAADRHIHQIITALEDLESYGYLVVESWMNMPTLNELLNNPQELKRLNSYRFMYNLALGLRAVHKRRLVHRELSPKSVFVEVDESDATLTNFELAKMLSDSSGTSAQTIPTVFTRRVPPNAYRAPEIAISPHDIDVRADIFSWGSVYYRLLTGRQFRNEPRSFQYLAALTEVKESLRKLVEGCLEADPLDRPSDIEKVIANFRDIH